MKERKMCPKCGRKMAVSAEGNYRLCLHWKTCDNMEIYRFDSKEGLSSRPLGVRDNEGN